MAPPAKRRKRAIVDDDSDDEDDQNKNTMKRFLSLSPVKTRSPDKSAGTQLSNNGAVNAAAVDSPSPVRKRTTRAAAATAASNPTSTTTRSPSTSPIKSRTRAGIQKKRKAEADKGKEKGRSADLLALFSKQAQRSQSSFSSATNNGASFQSSNGVGTGKLDDIASDPISEGNGATAANEDDDDDVPLVFSSSAAAASSLASRAQAAHKRFATGSAGLSTSSSRTKHGTGSNASSTGSSTQPPTSSTTTRPNGQRFLRPPPPPSTTTTTATTNTTRSTTTSPSKPKTQTTTTPYHLQPDDGADTLPWAERFAPLSTDELAVHKRKVSDVRRWLADVLAGRLRQQRLLVLRGPAGSGKTATVRLLARELGCGVLEWRNPNPGGNNGNGNGGGEGLGGGGYGGYQSAAAQFEEFLGRGGRFGQLQLDGEGSASEDEGGKKKKGEEDEVEDERRLMLVEEFPNTFLRSSAGLTGFRNAILQFLAASTPALGGFNAGPVTPVVMVISETLLTTTSASADSFTAHRLLGPEILRHPATGVIEFNPIAPTFLAKALELVVQKEARKSGRRRTPGPLVLQRLGEIGDIRSAISALEFLCVKGDDDADWGSRVAFTKPKRGAKDVPALTKGEQESLELVSQREATLGIFHAVGKVVYNKRSDFPPGSAKAEAEVLPDWAAHRSRPKKSEVSVDTLIDEIGTDTHTFISALHENYALSCEQSSPLDPNSSLDYLGGCLDYLSESDLLYPSWDVFFGGKGGYGGYSGKDSASHMLRQDEMAFQVAVRGLLYSLPSPVKRRTHPTGRGAGDAYKMFYPTYLKLWRSKEELEGLVDMWATKMLKGEDAGPGPPAAQSQSQPQLYQSQQAFGRNGSSAFRKPMAPGSSNGFAAASSTQPAPFTTKIQTPGAPSQHQHQHQDPPPPLSLGSAARQELLLERLPYTAHIARRRRCSSLVNSNANNNGTAMRIRDLERMVSFQGIGSLGAGEDDEEENEDGGAGPGAGGAAAESWATDKPVEEGGSPRKRRVRGLGAILSAGGGAAGRGRNEAAEEEGVVPNLPLQSLVISDDDIEDD